MEGSSVEEEEECGGASVGRDDACSSSSPGLAAPPPAAEAVGAEPGGGSSGGGAGAAPSLCSSLTVMSMAAASAPADDDGSIRYVLARLVFRRPCALDGAKESIGQHACELEVHVQAAVRVYAWSSGKLMLGQQHKKQGMRRQKLHETTWSATRQAWCGQGTLQPDWLYEKWI